MPLNIKTLIRTIYKKITQTVVGIMLLVIQHNDTQHYETHHNNIMLSDVMLSVIMVGVFLLNVKAPTCLPLLVTNDI